MRRPLAQGVAVDKAPPCCDKRQMQKGCEIAGLDRTLAAEVERLLAAELAPRVPEAEKLARYALGGGGKRLRPALFLLAAAACGARREGQPSIAAAIELVHTASILHDDVLDEAPLRRGVPAARLGWGDRASILVGDLLWCRASELFLGAGSERLVAAAARAVTDTTEGQLLELAASADAFTRTQSLEIARLKTASLFALAARAGAIVAGAPDAIERALVDYGTAVGVAFQLVDDAMDFAGTKERLGKAVGADLAQGTPTLPAVIALERCTGEEGRALRSVLTSEGEQEPERLAAARAVVLESGAVEETLALADEQIERARAALASLPGTAPREGLAVLAASVVERTGCPSAGRGHPMSAVR